MVLIDSTGNAYCVRLFERDEGLTFVSLNPRFGVRDRFDVVANYMLVYADRDEQELLTIYGIDIPAASRSHMRRNVVSVTRAMFEDGRSPTTTAVQMGWRINDLHGALNTRGLWVVLRRELMTLEEKLQEEQKWEQILQNQNLTK